MRKGIYPFILILATTLSAPAEVAAFPNKAIIRAIRGTGEVSHDGGKNWTRARVGQSLRANSEVKTAPESVIDLFLGENGPVVRVREETAMGIDRLDLENTGLEKIIETQLDLKAGRILGNVKKLAAASKYEIKTPVGVAEIRGTEYVIDSRGNLQVVSGTVVIVYIDQPVPVTVGAGEQVLIPSIGAQPTVTVIPATTFQALQGEIALLIVQALQPPPDDRHFHPPPEPEWPPPLPPSQANFDITSRRCLSPYDPACYGTPDPAECREADCP